MEAPLNTRPTYPDTILVYGGEPYVPDTTSPLKKLNGVKVAFPERPTSITFLLAKHTDRKDLPIDLEDHIAESDVVLLENATWTQEQQDLRNLISQGERKPFKLMGYQNSSHMRIDEALHHSGKPVRFCDTPKSRKNTAETPNAFSITSPNISHLQVLANMRKVFEREFRDRYYPRDRYILRSIYPTITEAVPDGTTLDRPTKALFIIGAAHQTIAHGLQERIAQQNIGTEHTVTAVRPRDYDHPTIDLYLDFIQGKLFREQDLMAAMLENLGGEAMPLPDRLSLPDVTREFKQLLGSQGVRAYMG